MKETTIQIITHRPVDYLFFKNSAAFTEEEVSTLKFMISNLSENGFLKVYELVEYKEMFVDPKYYPNAVKKIFHEDKPNMKITMDQFAEWVQKEHGDFVNYYLNHWDYTFNGAFVWKDEECIECMFDCLSRKPDFSLVHVETIPNVLDTFLSKEDAEGQMMAYDGYFPEKMEVKEKTLFGSETKVLRKLLSLLNL